MYKHQLCVQEVRFNTARCVVNADIILKRISQLRRFCRIPNRLLNSCRIPVEEVPTYAIHRTLTIVSNSEWNSSEFFPILASAFRPVQIRQGPLSFPSSVLIADVSHHLPSILTPSASSGRDIMLARRRRHLRAFAPTST